MLADVVNLPDVGVAKTPRCASFVNQTYASLRIHRVRALDDLDGDGSISRSAASELSDYTVRPNVQSTDAYLETRTR